VAAGTLLRLDDLSGADSASGKRTAVWDWNRFPSKTEHKPARAAMRASFPHRSEYSPARSASFNSGSGNLASRVSGRNALLERPGLGISARSWPETPVTEINGNDFAREVADWQKWPVTRLLLDQATLGRAHGRQIISFAISKRKGQWTQTSPLPGTA
jgi:hypothetical protein